ncbi:MAG: RNase adapter RapZ [Candidatus Babeliales bacterium]
MRQVVIVTGLSGAGKTSAMRALEDLGFYCVDNLPAPLVKAFLTLVFQTQTKVQRVALGIDSRGERFLTDVLAELNQLKSEPQVWQVKIIFLNAHSSTILKRFQETRRKHPLAEHLSIEQAIEKERQLLAPIMDAADMVLDTDVFNIHELRQWVQKTFNEKDGRTLVVTLVSFGFKYGVPSESNLVCDVRFLPNPYFVEGLRPFDGRSCQVRDYLFAQEEVIDYWERLTSFLQYSFKKFYEEGRCAVTVAIGCTGGKHRSVAIVEKLIQGPCEHVVFLPVHRDVERE